MRFSSIFVGETIVENSKIPLRKLGVDEYKIINNLKTT